jgi:hypothetical protein
MIPAAATSAGTGDALGSLKFHRSRPMRGASPPYRPHPPRRTRIVKRVITVFVVLDAVVLSAVMAWVVR